LAIFAKAQTKPKKESKEHGIPFTKTAASVAGKYVDKDVLATMDRTIKTVGGVDIAIPDTTGGIRLLGFTARNVYEYIAALLTYSAAAVLLMVYGIISGAGLIGPVMMTVAVMAYTIGRYRSAVSEYKSKFESQLPAVIDSMIQGLSIEMPVEQVISYIADTKSGVVTPFLKELRDMLFTGSSLESALAEVSAKTLSPDFERVARILSFRSETTAEMIHGLEQIRDNMETRLETQIMAKANNMENTMILPIMAGYVLPYLVIILYPLLTDLLKFFSAMGQ
jgi:tight adherence protein C